VSRCEQLTLERSSELVFLDDTIHRANLNAFAIVGAFAGFNDVNFSAHGNCILGAFGFASATGNTSISNKMSHFSFLSLMFLQRLKHSTKRAILSTNVDHAAAIWNNIKTNDQGVPLWKNPMYLLPAGFWRRA
jgi:hypothetical protein